MVVEFGGGEGVMGLAELCLWAIGGSLEVGACFSEDHGRIKWNTTQYNK